MLLFITARRYASAVYAVSRLLVCHKFTIQKHCSAEMVMYSITQTMQYTSTVFVCQRPLQKAEFKRSHSQQRQKMHMGRWGMCRLCCRYWEIFRLFFNQSHPLCHPFNGDFYPKGGG